MVFYWVLQMNICMAYASYMGRRPVDDYSDCEALELTRQRGRPKEEEYGEEKRKRNVCGRCGQKGHNLRSCRNAASYKKSSILCDIAINSISSFVHTYS